MTEPIWLVVEDDESIREFVSTCFELWGYKPLSFANGFEAMKWLDLVEKGEVDVVPELALLDIRLPGPKGHEIGKRLRSLPSTANVPIVIMTAFRVDAHERKEINDSANPEGFINKPLPPPVELEKYLKNIVEEAKTAPDKADAQQPATSAISKAEDKAIVKVEVKSEDKPDGKPELKEEVKSEDKPDGTPELKEEVKSDDKPDGKPEARAEVKPEDKPEHKPDTKAESKSTDKLDGKPEPKEEVKSEDKPDGKPGARAKVTSEDKTGVEATAKSEINVKDKPEDQPTVEVKDKPEDKPSSKPEEKAKGNPEPSGENSNKST